MNLISLCLCAAHGPLVGTTRRNSRIRHAVTLEAIIRGTKEDWPNTRRVTAACGAQVKIIAPIGWWAPRVRGTNIVRCPDCVAERGNRTRPGPKWTRP